MALALRPNARPNRFFPRPGWHQRNGLYLPPGGLGQQIVQDFPFTHVGSRDTNDRDFWPTGSLGTPVLDVNDVDIANAVGGVVTPNIGPDLTITGSPDTGHATPWTAQDGQSISCTGFSSADYLTTTDALDPSAGQDMVILCHAFLTRIGTNILISTRDGGSTVGWHIQYGGDILRAYAYDASSNVTSWGIVVLGWCLVGLTYDEDGDMYLYVNGTLLDNDTVSGLGSLAGGLGFGLNSYTNGNLPGICSIRRAQIWYDTDLADIADGDWHNDVAMHVLGAHNVQRTGQSTFTRASEAVYNTPKTETLSDGDMEDVAVTDWTVGNNATLTKDTTDPHSGTRCLRIAYNGTNNPFANLSGSVPAGRKKRFKGWARSDGTAVPRLSDAGGITIWEGVATHTEWQQFDVVYTMTYTDIYLMSIITESGYTEWDDISIKDYSYFVFGRHAPRAGSPEGLLAEPSGLTKVYNSGPNPQVTTGWSVTGGTHTIVDDSVALATVGLREFGPNVHQFANSDGVDRRVYSGAVTGNTNAHSLSVFARVVAGSGASLKLRRTSTGFVQNIGTLSDDYAWTSFAGRTPLFDDMQFCIDIPDGCTVRFILPQLEESPIVTSPIPNTATGSTATRAQDVLTTTHTPRDADGSIECGITPNGWSGTEPGASSTIVHRVTVQNNLIYYGVGGTGRYQSYDGTNVAIVEAAQSDGVRQRVRARWVGANLSVDVDGERDTVPYDGALRDSGVVKVGTNIAPVLIDSFKILRNGSG